MYSFYNAPLLYWNISIMDLRSKDISLIRTLPVVRLYILDKYAKLIRTPL